MQAVSTGPTIFSTQAIVCPKCGLATIQWGDDFSCLTCSTTRPSKTGKGGK